MEEKKRGGKRMGAGRKPIGISRKKQISLYIEQKLIYPFGNEEKMKDKLYDFISGYGKPDEQKVSIQDFTKPTNEIKPYEQPVTNYAVNTIPVPDKPLTGSYEAHKARILETRTIDELEVVMKEVKADLMTGREKQSLEAVAREHSKTMYND